MTESLTVLCVIHEASALRIHDKKKKKLEEILTRCLGLQGTAGILLVLPWAYLLGTWYNEFGGIITIPFLSKNICICTTSLSILLKMNTEEFPHLGYCK